MLIEKFTMNTELTYSENMDNTYAIKRVWDESKKKAVIIELYPTISVDRIGELDSSTCLLLNHMADLDLGEITVVNIYSKVFTYKPLVNDLVMDEENLSFLDTLFNNDEIYNKEIIIAWGSSHWTHKTTMEMKLAILKMLKEKKLDSLVKHIVPEFIDESSRQGVHPLFLGLRCSRQRWSLLSFDIDDEIEFIEKELMTRQEKKEKTALNKKKGKAKSVLQNKK